MKITFYKNRIRYYLFAIFFFYAANKNLFDLILGGLGKVFFYIVIILGAVLGAWSLLKEDDKPMRILIPFAIYVIWILINGAVFSNADQRPIGYKEYLLYPLSFFSTFWMLNNTPENDGFLKFLTNWGWITGLLALYEYIAKHAILSTGTDKIYVYYDGSRAYRAEVFCGSPMILCVMLGVAFIVCIYYIHFKRDLLCLPKAAIILVGMFATGSRAPLLCTFIGVALIYVKLFKEKQISRKIFFIIFILINIAVLFGTVIMLIPDFSVGVEAIDQIIRRFSSVFNFSTEWGNLERMRRWSYYIGVFLERPITGNGLAITSAEVLSNVAVTSHGITTESGILARLVESGIIGTVSYYLFVWNVVRNAADRQSSMMHGKKIYSNKYYVLLATIALFSIEDIILQISLDLIAMLFMWTILSYMLRSINSEE